MILIKLTCAVLVRMRRTADTSHSTGRTQSLSLPELGTHAVFHAIALIASSQNGRAIVQKRKTLKNNGITVSAKEKQLNSTLYLNLEI